VLADRVGCRSRRAALGPGRKAMGLARWLPAHAASSAGESAPEAGSRRRKPPAREQRHRWRAPRDPTRTTRKRRACSGEGALGDGRRPGAVRAAVFDETASGPSPATRGDGDAAAMPDPPRAHEDVRGRVASPSCGRKHRRREVRRGGAVDRGSARTASNRTRERTGPRLRTGRTAPPFGDHAMVAASAEAGGSPSSEAPPGWLTRQADSVDLPGSRRPPAPAQGEPVLANA